MVGDIKAAAAEAAAGAIGLDGWEGEECPEHVELDKTAGFWDPEMKFDPSAPPTLDWGQEQWLRENSLRRQTLHGYPFVLTPNGRQTLTPRLGRFDEDNEPGTLDPVLPRPAPSPDPKKMIRGQEENYK